MVVYYPTPQMVVSCQEEHMPLTVKKIGSQRVDKNFQLILKAKYKKNYQIGQIKKIPITKAIIDA